MQKLTHPHQRMVEVGAKPSLEADYILLMFWSVSKSTNVIQFIPTKSTINSGYMQGHSLWYQRLKDTTR